jgi:spore coat polysaccharide biosynthesis predicted glycosyltransferase SpsG
LTSAAFLVDTGPNVGLGHLRRSCVLLDAMTEAGFECRLYCADVDAALGRVASAIPASPADLPKSDIVICDSYRLSQSFLAGLRQRCRILLAFDDTGERDLDVDIVLNHNIYGRQLDYSARTRGQVLTGPDCALVDRRILAAAEAYRRNPAIDDVVVSCGGTDDGARGADFAAAALARTKAHFHLVIAPGIAPVARALALAAAQPQRVSLQRDPDMATLLSRARVYVGGAGVTALEALVIGLDLVLVVLAPNQRLNAAAMAQSGHAVIVMDDPEQIALATASTLAQPRVLKPSPVDGLGAARVVATIQQLQNSKRAV